MDGNKRKLKCYLLCGVTCQSVGQVCTEGALPHTSFPRQHEDLVFDCRQLLSYLCYSCGQEMKEICCAKLLPNSLRIYWSPNVHQNKWCDTKMQSYQGRGPLWLQRRTASGWDSPGMMQTCQPPHLSYPGSLTRMKHSPVIRILPLYEHFKLT